MLRGGLVMTMTAATGRAVMPLRRRRWARFPLRTGCCLWFSCGRRRLFCRCQTRKQSQRPCHQKQIQNMLHGEFSLLHFPLPLVNHIALQLTAPKRRVNERGRKMRNVSLVAQAASGVIEDSGVPLLPYFYTSPNSRPSTVPASESHPAGWQ